MLKIGLISEHASPLALAGSVDSGGQNIYVAQVATQLARLGHKVDVFTRLDDASLSEITQWQPNVRVIHVRAGAPVHIPKEKLLPHMDEFADRMLRILAHASEPYDVLHANFFMSAWAGLRCARALALPLITTFHALGRVRRAHQGEADAFPDCRFDMEDEVIEGSDCVIAECAQDREDLIALYGAPAHKIRIVPCGFDPTEMSPMQRHAARRRLGWPEQYTVLQLGRLVKRKDIENVVRAFAELKVRHAIRAHLYVVGGETRDPDPAANPEIARLTEIASTLHILDQVTFLGRRDRDELSWYYNAADVFVTTPWYEPFGITPVEAMACGLPVIGSAVGGIRTTVVDGKTGCLVPPKDPVTLADRLAFLYRHPDRRAAMGRAGRRRAMQLFTWQHVAQALMRVYFELADVAPFTTSAPRTALRPLPL